MAILAVPCAWLGSNVERKRKEHEAVEAITTLGHGVVLYDYVYKGRNAQPDFHATPSGPAWMRRILGEYFFSEPAAICLHFSERTGYGVGERSRNEASSGA